MKIIPPYAEYIKTIAKAGEMYQKEAFATLCPDVGHAEYIRAVCRNAGVTQEEIAMRVGVDKSNVARTLSRLERDGYVERRPNPSDRRSVLVYPTDQAYELLPSIVQVQSDWRAVLTHGMSGEEKEQLAELLERVEDNVRRWRLGELDNEEE